jgi:hypothetical protein
MVKPNPLFEETWAADLKVDSEGRAVLVE